MGLLKELEIFCQRGLSADREVLLGFAPARLLALLSFADTLDEDTGRGYQRRFNAKHSLDFRKYIQEPSSSTIPLTFNLRPRNDSGWRIQDAGGDRAVLLVRPDAGKVLVQVDCQHRLGYLSDVDVSLPFMSFIGLDVREEMEIFSVINSKAKGLSNSLLDFHDASLSADLGQDRPELFVALQLSSNTESPWYKQLDLGGAATSGLMRRASLRTMQKAVKRFLSQTKILKTETPETAAEVVIAFWASLAFVLREEWNSPRSFLINKGIGVYALMTIAADLYEENSGKPCDKKYFTTKLSDFLNNLDWSRNGPMKGLGGEGGVSKAVELIRQHRSTHGLKVVVNG
jgi:DNA sulfur modification protein DndB